MADTYESNFSGKQIDGALDRVINRDTQPQQGSDKLAESGGIHTFVEDRLQGPFDDHLFLWNEISGGQDGPALASSGWNGLSFGGKLSRGSPNATESNDKVTLESGTFWVKAWVLVMADTNSVFGAKLNAFFDDQTDDANLALTGSPYYDQADTDANSWQRFFTLEINSRLTLNSQRTLRLYVVADPHSAAILGGNDVSNYLSITSDQAARRYLELGIWKLS